MFFEELGSDILEVSHKRIECPSQSIYCNHTHPHCEMLLFVSGQAEYNIDGRLFHPEPYDLLFIPAATYHYLIPTAPIPYENYVIGVLPEMLGQPLYNRLFSKPRMLRVRDDDRLLDFFTRLDTYHRIYSPEDFARCAACIIQELATWCSYRRDDLNRSRSGSPAHIDEIIRYISENLTQPLDAARIADHFLLSKSYVQNLFSQTMHIGLKKYIQQKKIYAARAELQQGITPGEAAAKYGFADYSGFYRLYKATFGTAPAKRSPTENTTPR